MNRDKKSGQQHSVKRQLGIYIHIPFCVRKCAYCDFLSDTADDATKRTYAEALMKEIEIESDRKDVNGYGKYHKYQVKTIFFGGGTPSILAAELIEDILDTIQKCYDVASDAEISIECNPGTVDTAKFGVYRDAGINRISFGLQSTNDDELSRLGRIHTYAEFLESYQMARMEGFQNINVDLMAALPNQTIESYRQTVEKVIELQPEHISAYSLIIEENTKLYDEFQNHNIEVPDEDTEREMYYLTEKLLCAAGYDHYEISNYSKKGYECKHNLSYWERENYIGFGVGAASLFEETRYSNIREMSVYIKSLKNDINIYTQSTSSHSSVLDLIRTDVIQLSQSDQMEEFMFLGLRKIAGISVSLFQQLYKEKIRTIYGTVIDKYSRMQLLELADDTLRLTPRGVDVSNVIMSEFIL